MKKKILLLLALIALMACMLAIAVNAEGLIALDNDPGLDCDESMVSYFSSIADPKVISKTERAVITDGTKFYVVPTYYIVGDSITYYGSYSKFNTAVGYDLITSLKTNLVRVQLPSGMKQIRQDTAKFENYTALKEIHFPLTLTIIQAQDAFNGCSNLEYISSIEHMTEINVACFSNCKKLSCGIVWPSAVKSIGRDMFANCTSLTSVTISDGVTTIGTRVFSGCTGLTEIRLPNSVTDINKGAFINCTNLVTFSFGAGFTTFVRANNDFETLQNTKALKYVYLPEATAFAIEAKSGDYKNIFTGSSNVTFFFTGSLENATLLRDKMKATGANEPIGNAEVVLYDPNIDYTTYAQTLGKSIIVANYSACEAFYNGEHNVSEHYSLEYSGEEFLSTATKSKACAKCVYKVDKSELGALFVSLGYSTNGRGSVIQGFSINSDMLSAYEEVLGEITYGVIAAGDTREDKTVGADVFSFEKKVFHELSGSAYDYFQVMVNGIDESKYDAYIFFCAYVQAGEKCYYINEGVTDTVATSTTYNIATA